MRLHSIWYHLCNPGCRNVIFSKVAGYQKYHGCFSRFFFKLHKYYRISQSITYPKQKFCQKQFTMSSHKRNKILKTENIIVMLSQNNNYIAYDYWHQPISKKGVEYCANNKHKCETKSNIWKTTSCSRKSWKRQFSYNACICPNIRTKKTLKTQKNLANIYLFKVNIKNTRKRCKICSMSTIKTPKQRHWRHSVFL